MTKCKFCEKDAVTIYRGIDEGISLCKEHDSAIRAVAADEVLGYLADILEEIESFEEFRAEILIRGWE